jgi:CRISPR-associated protein (Cas_CXXC_CXXC)
VTRHGYTAEEFPLSGSGADDYTHDRLEDMDACPNCGESLGYSPRRHRCKEDR